MSARGEAEACAGVRNSWVPEVETGTPGMNLSESRFGVVSVWMKMERSALEERILRE